MCALQAYPNMVAEGRAKSVRENPRELYPDLGIGTRDAPVAADRFDVSRCAQMRSVPRPQCLVLDIVGDSLRPS